MLDGLWHFLTPRKRSSSAHPPPKMTNPVQLSHLPSEVVPTSMASSPSTLMDARTLLGLLGRERRRLRRTREAAPRHAECQARFGPPGRARPRRQSQSEGAWRGRRPSTWAPLRRASAQPTHPYTSAAMDEPNWIFYDELESAAAASRICPRQKPQRFIRAFRALHISRSSTRLSPSDPSRSASPRSLASGRAT